jgi:N-acetyl sugar amidotransferase
MNGRFCQRCVMPIWDEANRFGRPGLELSEDGKTCVACARAQAAKSIDWNVRWKELEALCDRHRKHDGSPDVIVPVSGGKDSHYQVWLLRQLGMHPFLVTVCDCFGSTQAGVHNYENLSKLACGAIRWRQNTDQMKLYMRIAFERFGSPTWPVDLAIYAVPPRIAAQMKIPLIVYGENISWTYGGSGATDTPSAMAQIYNDVVRPYPIELTDEDKVALRPYEGLDIEPVYLSYFVPWDGRKNAELAKSIGFRDAAGEWDRKGCCENYDQIDSLGYMVHPMLKWFKFGAARVSDVMSNWIRNGYVSREYAVGQVHGLEGFIDQKAADDFCSVLGYSRSAFLDIVRVHVNPNLFLVNSTAGNGYHSLRKAFQVD